jgi:hypothetical protein
MELKKKILAAVCFALLAAAAPALRAQNCVASQDAAVECFVSNALRTDLLIAHHGLTAAQFETYGVAVSKILQAQQASLVTMGLASAVADAMPPTNADGSANTSAQQTAVNAIVDAEVADGLVTLPAETTSQQLKYFSLDLVRFMTDKNGMILAPGSLLRLVDSYVVTGTVKGTVNWTQVDANLSTAVDNLESTKLLKLPPALTAAQLKQFVDSLAKIIYNYKVATKRSAL